MFILLPHLKNTISYATSSKNYILLKNVRSIVSQSSVAAEDISTEPKWQLVSAACITRPPIICPPMNPIEDKYKNLINKLEVRKSSKSEHEIRLEEDKLRTDLLNAGDSEEISAEEAAKQTAFEFEDSCKEELKAFTFAPLITDADVSNDTSSLNRSLNKTLVLSVTQKLGSQDQRIFPQTAWIPGESLKNTCERVIKEVCGSQVKVKVLGNSPCGHFKYKYPKEVRKNGYIGAKVFFFSAHVLEYSDEELNKCDEFSDYKWLTHEELKGNLGKSYYQAISKFLISDD